MNQDNASCAQYGCPTPTPTWTIGVPTPGKAPAQPLPYTGFDALIPLTAGILLVVIGIMGRSFFKRDNKENES